MMRLAIVGLSLLFCSLLPGADKPPPVTEASNQNLAIRATLYKQPDQIRDLLGQKLEKGIVVVKVTVTPRGGKPLELDHDDFLLRSDKDGEKSEPYDPGQIAGDTVLTVIYSDEGGGAMAQQNGPVWGGMGGGMPGRLPGSGPGSMGNATSVETASDAHVDNRTDDSHNKLLAILRDKILPEGEITKPVTGLLYFPLEGKHKYKQLWLHYVGDAGRLDLHFKRKH